MKILDTHLHLLYPDSLSYGWTRDHEALSGPAPVEVFEALDSRGHIAAALMMEADVDEPQIEREIDVIGEVVARDDNRVIGMIAACRPEHAPGAFAGFVDRLAAKPHVKGLRRILHTSPDGLSQTDGFATNLNVLAARGYPFDMCVLSTQLTTVGLPLARRCPDLTIVLDHCGVPDIRGGMLDPWRAAIRAIAALPNVHCKVSGIVAYAGDGWQVADLRPYVEHVVECFGWDRLVWGSDWPVCRLGGDLPAWLDATQALLEGCSADEQAALLHDNAQRVYRLV
ncbi:MAG: amidohydrolase family protein [Pararobbsia sp.]